MTSPVITEIFHEESPYTEKLKEHLKKFLFFLFKKIMNEIIFQVRRTKRFQQDTFLVQACTYLRDNDSIVCNVYWVPKMSVFYGQIVF